MRAKPELVPDCDVHGESMYRDECRASDLGLEGSRDIIVWRCAHPGCTRYFEGAVGYRNLASRASVMTPRCAREGAFLVTQRALSRYVCPVEGCANGQAWSDSKSFDARDREPEAVLGRMK